MSDADYEIAWVKRDVQDHETRLGELEREVLVLRRHVANLMDNLAELLTVIKEIVPPEDPHEH